MSFARSASACRSCSGRPGLPRAQRLGETRSSRLPHAAPDEARSLFRQAALTIADVHARGAYLGQRLARNITVDSQGRIGFPDFEEDPGELMPLTDAQSRDWLVVSAGAARYLPLCDAEVGEVIAEALRGSAPQARDAPRASVERLDFVRVASPWFGRGAGGLAKALHGLHRELMAGLAAVALLALGVDYAGDRDLDILETVVDWAT